MNSSSINSADDLIISSFEFSGHVFREDTFGIIKRLRYFIKQIESFRLRAGLDPKEVKILDIGCGTGINVTIPLALAGYNVTGTDVDQPSIEKAKNLSSEIPNLSFANKSLEDFDSVEKFHVIICSEVMEHLQMPEEMLNAIYPRLDDTGILLITVPNGYGYFEMESFVEKCLPGITKHLDSFVQPLVRGISKYTNQSWRQRHLKERTREHCDLAISTLESESVHCNKFNKRSIRSLIEENNYKIANFSNRTFLAGNILNVLVRECDFILRLNDKISDYLPNWLCSGWLISAKKAIHDELINKSE